MSVRFVGGMSAISVYHGSCQDYAVYNALSNAIAAATGPISSSKAIAVTLDRL